MAGCTKCTLCENPGTLDTAVDTGRVPCNVRQFRDHVFTLWRCTGCGSLHCAEDADLPFYYANYPLKQQKVTFSERVGYRNRMRILERLGLRKDQSVLDYGCGAGLFVKFLRENGYTNVRGYDAFVDEYLDPKTLEQQYDAVVSYDVIEHDEDVQGFVARLSRLVRPGGLLAIGTPNADGVAIQRIGDPSLHVPYHRHILSKKTLLQLGRAQGLEPVHVYGRSFYDSLVPTVNSRFMWRYITENDGLLDAAVEPPNTGVVFRSPQLVFLAFFGYFLPRGDNMLITFRKPA